MQVQLDIPDDITDALSDETRDISRSVLEAIALEGYRSRRLSEYQIQRMLGFDHRLRVHAFLKENDTPMNYSIDDLDHDMETLRDLRQFASTRG